MRMNEEEKERLIKKDILSIENRVRHAFNQGYNMGLKERKTETITEFADRCRECGKRYVKRQTGHWITEIKSDIECGPIKPRCSECGGEPYYSNSIYNYKFCPYCGTKMVKARQFAELVAAEISDEWELVKPQESEE